jgi:phosphatidylglycerol---prolipoprotein diacylglyceryl transferase
MHVCSDTTVTQHHYWVDNLNPWILHFSGNFGIRWYGVSYLMGIVFAAWLFSRWSKQGYLPIPTDQVSTFITYAATGVFAGGRLGYCLFYNASEIRHHPLEIIAIWHGGMASHGGILGLVLATCIFCLQRNFNPMIFLDAIAAAGPLGIAFGRTANFINGELWGRPSNLPWAVIFPEATLIHGINVPRHPSQLYAAALEGVLVFLVAQWVYRHTSRHGITTASVCVVYGICRFIDEFWREPDAGQAIFFGWMSKGQLLTIPMVALGIVLAIWCSRTTKSNSNLSINTKRCEGFSLPNR